jgi:hypothetical protein
MYAMGVSATSTLLGIGIYTVPDAARLSKVSLGESGIGFSRPNRNRQRRLVTQNCGALNTSQSMTKSFSAF